MWSETYQHQALDQFGHRQQIWKWSVICWIHVLVLQKWFTSFLSSCRMSFTTFHVCFDLMQHQINEFSNVLYVNVWQLIWPPVVPLCMLVCLCCAFQSNNVTMIILLAACASSWSWAQQPGFTSYSIELMLGLTTWVHFLLVSFNSSYNIEQRLYAYIVP